jgi:ribose transport system substrate-binding protein
MRHNHRSRHYAALLATAVVAALALTGCTGAEPKPDTTSEGPIKTIAYADATTAVPQFKAVGDAFIAAAEAQGIEVIRFDNDMDPTQALNNAKLMVQQEPDLIVDWSAAATANPAIGELFDEAGIPCVALNVAIPSCAHFNQRSGDLGAAEAVVAIEEMEARGWTPDDTTLLLVWAPAAGAEINELATVFYSDFAAAYPEMEQREPADIPLTTSRIGESAVFVDGAGALQQTNTVVNQALQGIASDRNLLVVVLNDESGLGAKQALDSSERTGEYAIISNVASEQGLAELRDNPNWVAEGSVFFDLWGGYALAMALAIADGAEPPELTVVPTVVLTKENVDEYYEGSKVIKEPELLAENDYLAPYLEQMGGSITG